MTKSELIEKLSLRLTHISISDSQLAVGVILDTISGALASGNRVEVRGFGSFALNYRPPRKGRNPKSGESVDVPGKFAPHFRAGKELRERVYQGGILSTPSEFVQNA